VPRGEADAAGDDAGEVRCCGAGAAGEGGEAEVCAGWFGSGAEAAAGPCAWASGNSSLASAPHSVHPSTFFARDGELETTALEGEVAAPARPSSAVEDEFRAAGVPAGGALGVHGGNATTALFPIARDDCAESAIENGSNSSTMARRMQESNGRRAFAERLRVRLSA
jgi:hypothetical protein